MVRSISAILVIIILVLLGTIFEQVSIKNSFSKMQEMLIEAYDKFEEETESVEDVQKISDYWNEKKKLLHTIIPHNDIKDIEKLFSETIELKKNNLDLLAKSKIRILIDISTAIPETYRLTLENIF